MTNQNSVELPRLIAIVGREGSGKDSYGEYLAERGYMHVSAGDVLRERAREQGYSDPIPRAVLSHIGDRLKQELGPGPIALSTLIRYEGNTEQHPAGLAISGFRRAEEVEVFKSHGAIALWITASLARRFENQRKRGRDDHQTLAEFAERSNLEYFGTTDGGSEGVNLRAVEALADCEVANDSTLQELFVNADQALAALVS
jgi:dephospho-CoA kinase